MIKLMTIVGTRPELIKMSRVIALLDKYTNHILVHTGQNFDYELNEIFFDDLEIRKPDYFLEAGCETPAQTIAKVIERSDDLFLSVQPDALILYGDTNSCLSIIPAKRQQIPVFHMEAGNRCFDQRVPEELNRKIVDHLSDVNLVLTEHARRYLIAEGLRPETIIKTGSHMNEVLDYYMPKINSSDIVEHLNLTLQKYFLVSIHREENVDSKDNLLDLLGTFNALASTYGFPIVVSTHPRTRKRIESLSDLNLNPLIRFLKPFGFCDYIKLQIGALCVISDSGTITEEASILSLSAITVRNAHERPEGMDAGTLIMSGLKEKRVLNAVNIIISQAQSNELGHVKITDYSNPTVSSQILRVILSYLDYINRTVWQKQL